MWQIGHVVRNRRHLRPVRAEYDMDVGRCHVTRATLPGDLRYEHLLQHVCLSSDDPENVVGYRPPPVAAVLPEGSLQQVLQLATFRFHAVSDVWLGTFQEMAHVYW